MTTPDPAARASRAPRHQDPPPAGLPELRNVATNLVRPNEPGTGVVVESRVCTARPKAAGFVRHVSIDVTGSALAGNFAAGQAFGVIPPGVDERGKPHKLRLYSIASPSSGEDGEGNVLATTVKRTIDEHWDDHRLFLGVASNYLCDLQPGDEVRVTGPSGKRFVLPVDPERHDYIFFATGTGIAPFRGMLLEMLGAGVSSRITLVMGSPYSSDLLYHDDLLRLAEDHDNFRYITAISRERYESDDDRPVYVQDRIASHRDELGALLDSERTLIYICGIAGMELGIFQRMTEMLTPSVREQYLAIDPEHAADIRAWERRMINRQIRPTGRVLTEVY